jgi:site-specific recombinase XerD
MSVLRQNQQVKDEEEVYFNFINSIKSEVTKKVYEEGVKLYLKFCNLSTLSELLMITDPQKQIIEYIMSLRKRGLSSNTISTWLLGIYHLYEMNDVPLNKKKINMFKGEFSRKVIDRAYRHEEISKILDVSDLRMKVIILLMASTGMRVGALPSLRIRNLEKIDSVYKVTVYEGTNQQYYTFCTPECASYIDAYFEQRTHNGEKIDNDSYLIRNQFDITDLEQIRNKSKGVKLNTIRRIVDIVLIKSGVKTVDRTSRNRKEVAK